MKNIQELKKGEVFIFAGQENEIVGIVHAVTEKGINVQAIFNKTKNTELTGDIEDIGFDEVDDRRIYEVIMKVDLVMDQIFDKFPEFKL